MSDPNFNNNNVNPPPKKGGTSIALIVGGLVVAVIVLYWLFAGGTDVDNADMVGEETNINVDAGAESAAEQHRVGTGLGQVRGIAHGDGDVGAGQHRYIVDAITHHQHLLAGALALLHVGQLVVGAGVADRLLDLQFSGDSVHHALVVA